MEPSLAVASIATAIAGGTAVLIVATGELLVQKTGVYNIGLEGLMLVGALAGFAAMTETTNIVVGLLAGIGAGGAFALVFGLATVVFRADMLISGLALVFIGTGLTGELGEKYIGIPAAETIPRWEIPGLADIPVLGDALFKQLGLVYIAFLLPFAAALWLSRTRHGLDIRAIGEDPATADAVGIGVVRWRLAYIVVGGMFAGLGGAFLTLGTVQAWIFGVTSGQGFIALAIVIFAGWRAVPLIFGAYLFGGLGTLGNVGQAEGWAVPSQFFSALPYLGTLAVLVSLAWIRSRRQAGTPWPTALGQVFFRGAE